MVQLAERAAPAAEAVPDRRHDIAVVFFGVWMATALYIDAWNHLHKKPETFFSPWHALLYSGFVAAVLYFAVQRWRMRGTRAHAIDKLGVFGLVFFFLASLGDLAWHTVFGIEVNLEALLSPSHLGLLAAGVIIFSTPFRTTWRRPGEESPSFRRFLPVLISIVLCTTVVSFFLSYFSAFQLASLVRGPTVGLQFLIHAQGIGSVLVTNLVLLVPTLLILRRWRPPVGALTILYSIVAFGIVALDSFTWPKLGLAGVAGGVAADIVIVSTRSKSQRFTARLIGGVVPLAMWSAWVGAVRATWGIQWGPALVWGMVALAVLSGTVLSILAFPMPVPEPKRERTPELELRGW